MRARPVCGKPGDKGPCMSQKPAGSTWTPAAGEQQVTTNAKERIKARQRAPFMKLCAPVGGFVQQVAVYTIAGVVTAAQQLMVTVPKNDPLDVEAFVANKEIGCVSVGREAEIKIESFQ